MAKTATVGEEYKVLKQKSTPKRIAKILILLWIVCVMAPALYLIKTQAQNIKEFAVVKAVWALNDVLKTQYEALTDDVLKSVNINQYTSKIQVPEIKLDKLNTVSDKTRKTAGALAKLGIKEAAQVETISADLQQRINKVNAELQASANKVRTTLQSDITAALQKELSDFADTQVQKQLGIGAAAYQMLIHQKFGLIGDNEQKATQTIYRELSDSQQGFLSNTLITLNIYFKWVVWGVMAFIILVGFIPIFIVWSIAKKLSANFTECPYCHKVFLSKKAKLNLLKLFR